MSKPAKSVIEVWLGGGPSQLETFDPKPDAPAEYGNSLKSTKTAGGFYMHEWMPRLAKCADLFSVVRTLTHPDGGHESAAYRMQTGHVPGAGIVYPAIGAVVSSMKRKEYQGDIPPYVMLTGNTSRFSVTGFLGEASAPFVTGGNPSAWRFQVEGFVPPGGTTVADLERRLEIAAQLDFLPRDDRFETAGESAMRVFTGIAAETFDLTREASETRDRYGRNITGQSLMAARRLVEYGVPYVTVNSTGWDSHHNHFGRARATNELDQALAALLTDLKERKLLNSTIVWVTGEFGRTPKIDWAPEWQGGRHHFPKCFSALVAGGGFKGGAALGESDETASNVVSRPVTPTDFLGSICELAGIDPDGPLPNPAGRKVKVMPTDSKFGRMRELYA